MTEPQRHVKVNEDKTHINDAWGSKHALAVSFMPSISAKESNPNMIRLIKAICVMFSPSSSQVRHIGRKYTYLANIPPKTRLLRVIGRRRHI